MLKGFLVYKKMWMRVFYELLSIFPYHPVLWSLYYTCRTFYNIKPDLEHREHDRVIQEYYEDEDFWLKGHMGNIRDVIMIDDTVPGSTWGFVTMLENPEQVFFYTPTIFIVPRAWLKYLVFVDEHFVLLPKPFCCRPIIKRSTPCAVRCQSLVLPKQRVITTDLFHIGVGECFSNDMAFYSEFRVYLGLKQLYETVKKNNIEFFPIFLYVLGRKESSNKLISHIVTPNNVCYPTRDVLYILRHILVCKNCNSNLLDFIRIVIILIYKSSNDSIIDQIEAEITEVVYNYMDDKGCPVLKYYLDADYDNLFSRAINKKSCDTTRLFLSECAEVLQQNNL
jgi:hypothetical protein